jgi:hypothetical protein
VATDFLVVGVREDIGTLFTYDPAWIQFCRVPQYQEMLQETNNPDYNPGMKFTANLLLKEFQKLVN